MLIKKINYTDFNGVERSEDFMFNLTKSEITEMQLEVTGGLTERLQKIVDTEDVPSIIEMFKELILKSYGEKSADGKSFIKLDENGNKLANQFKQTAAYDALYMELASDAEVAATFINGVLPADLVAAAESATPTLTSVPTV